MAQLIRATASHTRWGYFFGIDGSGGPFNASLLLLQPSHYDADINHTWNSGRFAPDVMLRLTFDRPVTILKLCPSMKPAEGRVGLVITAGSRKTPHYELWQEGEWVAIALPEPSSDLLIEFMESPSWIALHAVDAS